jgi:serine protease
MKKQLKKIGFTVLSFCSFAQTIFSQTIVPGYVDGVVHLKLNDNSILELDPYQNNVPALNVILVSYNVDTIYKPFKLPFTALDKIYRIRFSNSALVENLIADLELIPDVEFAEKIPLYNTSSLPNDFQQQQWSLIKVRAEEAWGLTTGNSNIVIAVVDNAVLHSHADLAANRWINTTEQNGLPGFDDDLNGFADDIYGYDVADGDANPEPPLGTLNTSGFMHGTHCAGIAVGVTNNGLGMASLSYNCKLMSVKCSSNSTDGNELSSAQDGIFYAMRAGADIISMSFGSPADAVVTQLVINQAYANGVVLIGAAGNENNSIENFPGAHSNVVAVGATDQNDVKAGFSNFGSWVDVMAPGVSIYSTLPENGTTYGERSGTSMATPLVAALAGLIKSYFPGLTNAQVKDKILQGCENIDALNPGFTGQLGAGRINAYHSLNPVGITVVDTNDDFLFFPNPLNSSASLFLKTTDSYNSKTEISLYTSTGKLIFVKQINIPVNGLTELYEFKSISPGVYSFVISSVNKISIKKLIIL